MTEFGNLIQCGHCGLWHTGLCQRIKSIEYHENGTVKRVEYHPDSPWFYWPANTAGQPAEVHQ